MRPVVLLTGASAEIGEEIAIRLSKSNDVILTGRNNEKLSKTQAKLAPGCTSYIISWDLNNLEHLEATLIQFLKGNPVKINKFVHCAGVLKMVPIKIVSAKILIESFTTNIFSAALLVRLLVDRNLNNSKLDAAVFISSNISNRGAKAMSVYGATKSALDGLMRSLAVELAPKVRVNSILPGAILSKMTQEIFSDEEKVARMINQYPLGLGHPADIASAVEFILSDDAKWITGEQLTIDGGRSINVSV